MSANLTARIEKAEVLLQQGHLTSVHFELKKILRQDPNNVRALILKAEHSLSGRDRAACLDTIDTLFGMQPDDFDGALQKRLGHVCFENNLYQKAAQLLRWAKLSGVEDNASLLQLGIANYQLLNTQDAESHFKELIGVDPKFDAAYLHLGHVYKAQGKTGDATANYRKYIELSTHAKGTGYWHLADLKTYVPSDADLAEIRCEIELESQSLPQLSALQFALGRAAEFAKDFATAMRYFKEANAIQAKLKPFNAALYERVVTGLQSVAVDESPLRTNAKPTAILIVGLPRSGTTLVEQILSSHSRVQATDELPLLEDIAWQLNRGGDYLNRLATLTAAEKATLRRVYIDGACAYIKRDCDYFIDKNPKNFLHIGLAKRIMPEAVILDVRRDPRDVAISAYRQLFNFTYEFSTSFAGIYEYYRGYLEMIDHWKTIYPEQIKTVVYEELVHAPNEQIEALLTFCGLANEAACFEFHKQQRAVMTPGAEQVSKPMYTSSIGQWRHYEEYVPEEMSRLGSLLTESNCTP